MECGNAEILSDTRYLMTDTCARDTKMFVEAHRSRGARAWPCFQT
jgi:hypothetical protein